MIERVYRGYTQTPILFWTASVFPRHSVQFLLRDIGKISESRAQTINLLATTFRYYRTTNQVSNGVVICKFDILDSTHKRQGFSFPPL